jgi:16S rRNA (cytosine967-C5)-methyltransferase
MNLPGPITLRTNGFRISRDALRERLAAEGMPTEPAPRAPHALHVAPGFRPNFLGSAAYREGLFEIQDEGSQLLGHLVQARPGERVLDLCAGAGGKTLLLAADMENQGELWATDVDRERLGRLERRAERAGVRNLKIAWSGELPEALKFDAVLVDAPCSELGALRRGVDLRFRLRPETFGTYPKLQGSLLERAATLVKPGGRLVYATCTLRREENEEVVQSFLGRRAGTRTQGSTLKLYPHRDGTDGFFAAILAQG